MADLVLWKPEFFGAKPEILIKGGQVVATGFSSSLSVCGKSSHANSVLFISKVIEEKKQKIRLEIFLIFLIFNNF